MSIEMTRQSPGVLRKKQTLLGLAERFVKETDSIGVTWAEPYARHKTVTKLQARDGYRLRIGDWRVIYELHRLELWVLEVGARGGIY